MTIATKNGAIIVKDGKLAEDCGCCGGWYCYGEPCRNTSRTPRTEMWNGCDGDNSSPATLQLSFEFSGEQRQTLGGYWDASTSLNATYTFTRQRAWATPDGECVYFFTDNDYLMAQITTGVACGSGWDALFTVWGAIKQSYGGQTTRPVLRDWGLAPMYPKHSRFQIVNQPSPKGQTPILTPFPGSSNQWETGWSNVTCSTSPNPTLSGFSWELWCYPLESFGVPMTPFLACTVRVV